MSKVLGRSKSMRLRSSPRDLQYDSPSIPTAEPFRSSQDTKPSSTSARSDSVTRPRTASGGSKEKEKSAHPKHVPIIINNNTEGFDFTQPSPTYYGPDAQDAGAIGMALGSPTQSSPAVFSPLPPEKLLPALGITQGLSQGTTTTIINADPSESFYAKPKVSRWKSIFGGKRQAEPSPQRPFYLAQPLPSQQAQLGSELDVHSAFKSPSPVPSPMLSEADDYRGRQKSRRNVLDSTKKRMMSAQNSSSARLESSRSRNSPDPPPKEFPSRQVPRVMVSNESGSFSPTSPPLLDIDIPKIEMERYSVMFSSLLGSAPSNSRNSSLLVRRQGNADKLAPLDERALNANTHLRPQRRATSPVIKKSPLSLFPHSPSESRTSLDRSGTLNRPRPLQRSRTLPTGLSPSQRSFDLSDDGYSEEPSTAGFSAGLSTAPLTDDSDFRPIRPDLREDYEIEREFKAIENLRKFNAWKPTRNEPAWEIINGPMDSPGQQPAPSSRAKTSTMRIVAASPSAQVGVARTVSVSRPMGTPNLLKPNIASPERLVDKKPLTPTLVELKNRKSQRVQIVDA